MKRHFFGYILALVISLCTLVPGNVLAAPIDNTAPTASLTTTTDVPLMGPVVIQFDEYIIPATLSVIPGSTLPEGTIKIVDDATGNLVAGAITFYPSTNQAVFIPSSPLISGKTYTVTNTADPSDAAGNTMVTGTIGTFKTTTTTDTVAPTATLLTTTNVAQMGPVLIQFSEVMQNTVPVTITSGVGGTVQVKNGTGDIVAGTIAYDASTNIATFTPTAPFAGGTTYTVYISTGLSDLSGNALPAYTAPSLGTFATVGAPDTTSPIATLLTTADVALNGPVVISFDEAMLKSTITASPTGAVIITDATGNYVPGTIEYSDATNKSAFIPSASFAGATTYNVQITTGPTDVAGNHLVPFTPNTFSTTVGADTIAPTATLATIADVALAGPVVIQFSEAMQETTISTTPNGAVIVIDGAGNYVAGSIVFDSTTNKASFTPFAPFASEATYTVYITTGPLDLAGNPLAAFPPATFKAIKSDTVKPTAALVITTDVGLNGPVEIQFSEPVVGLLSCPAATDTTPGGIVTLLDINTNFVAGKICFDSVTNKASFTPTAPFNSTLNGYTVYIATGLNDLAGNSFDATGWPKTFTVTTAMRTVTTNALGSGAVTPSTVQVIPTGGTVTYTLTPGNVNYVLDSISLNGVTVLPGAMPSANPNGTYSYTTPLINTDTTVVIMFSSGTYALTASAIPAAGGSITPAIAKASTGGSQTYTVTAASGYTLVSVIATNKTSGATTDLGLVSPFTLSGIQSDYDVVATFIADTIKPVAVLDTKTNVGFNGPVVISFDETMDKASITTGVTGSVLVKDSLGNLVDGKLVYDATTNKASFVPTAPFAANASYIVSITSAAKDLAGNSVATFPAVAGSDKFQTTTAMVSVTASVSGSGSLTIYDLQGDTNNQLIKVSLAGVNATNSNNGRLYWNLINSGAGVTLSLYHDAAKSQLMAEGTDKLASGSITIMQKNASGISGTVLYTGAGITDNDAANILDVVSVPAGSSNVSITVSSGTNRTISAEPELGSDLFQYSYDNVPMVDTIKSAGLVQKLTNIVANHTADASFSKDLTPPTVTSKAPDNLATGVLMDTTVKVVFSEAIDQTSVDDKTQTGFSLKDNGDNNITWTVAKSVNSLTFTLAGSLLPNKTYTATITQAIKDLAGNALDAPVIWSFETMKSPHAITLNAGANGTVTSVPANLATVPEGTNVVFTITPMTSGAHPWYKIGSIMLDNGAQAIPAKNLDGTYTYTVTNILADHTVDVAFVKLPWVVTAAPVSNGVISSALTPLDASGKVTVANNDTVGLAIKPNVGYVLSTLTDNGTPVALGSASLTKSLNADGTYTWAYTISNIISDRTVVPQFVADAIPPTVLSVTPAENSTGIDPNTAINVVFSESIAASSIDQATQTGFTLKNLTSNSTVAWTVVKSASGAGFTFTPAVPLALGTQFEATLPATITDLSPNKNTLVSAKTWTFTTRAATHNVTVLKGANGDFSSSPAAIAGVIAVNDGANAVLTITPLKTTHPWYQLAGILVDGNAVQLSAANADGTYTFTIDNVTSDHTAAISFSPVQRTVTLSAVTNGSVSVSTAIDASGNMTVVDGGSLSLTFIPNTGYYGYYLSDIKFDGVSKITGVVNNAYTVVGIISNMKVDVTYSLYPYKMDIIPPITITGKVELIPQAGNSILGDVVYFIPGATPAFKITPARGYELDTLSLGGTDVKSQAVINATDGTYSYTTPPGTVSSVLAVAFKLITYNLTMTTLQGNGTITSNAQKDASNKTYVYYGGSATFTAAPNAGYTLKDFTVDGTSVMSQVINNGFTLSNITAPHTVDVEFELKYTVTATAGSNGSISPAGASFASPGVNLLYTFTPATGYQVSGIKVDGTTVTPLTNNYTFNNLAADHSIDVTFGIKQIYVTVASSITNGTVSLSSSTANYGSSVDAVVTPGAGYKVTDIRIKPAGGTDISVFAAATQTASGTFRYTLTQLQNDCEITAVFGKLTYVITTSSSTYGTIAATSTTPTFNSSVSFTVTPNSGYNILDVTVDGVSVKSQLTANQFTLNNIVADHSVAASFAIINHAITSSVNNSALGSITPFGSTMVSHGGSQKYQITAAPGATLADLFVDGVSAQVVSGAFTFNNVTTDHSIVANFISSGSVVYPDGDINLDGKVDISDALLALQMSIGVRVPTATDILHGDVGPMNNQNKPVPDGKIDIDDAVVLLQRAVGNIPVW